MNSAVGGKAGAMDRNDLRRADNLFSFWDDVVLGRAPADPSRVGDDVAELIEQLQTLGDLPDQDAARARVWRDLEAHPRWKEPGMESSVVSLNGSHGPTPDTATSPNPASPAHSARPVGAAPRPGGDRRAGDHGPRGRLLLRRSPA